MAITDFDERQAEIREYHREFGWFYKLLGGLILVLFGVWIGSQLFADDSGYNTNLYTELLGIGVTVFILNELAKRREVRQLQEQLVRNAASTSNEIAKDAVHQLRRQGWLTGEKGLLKGKNLRLANLESAKLFGANLSRTNLVSANLSGADLLSANLSNAQLIGAELHGAHLFSVNLGGANLSQSNLSAAVGIASTSFDKATLLPDGSRWTSETDMGRYTNPEHPNFWHPEDGRW